MLPKSARLGIANDTFLRGQFPDAGVGPYALIADVGRLTGLGSFVPETAETYHVVSVVKSFVPVRALYQQRRPAVILI